MASLKSITHQGKRTCSDLKKLCDTGKVPTAVYGYGTKNTSVKIGEAEPIKVIHRVGYNGVIDLGVGPRTIGVTVSDYRFDPLKNQVTHTDFLAVNMAGERTVDVPVQLVGEAVGAREDGVIEQPLFDLQTIATPENTLESIEVGITDLQINDSYSVGDIKVSGDFATESDSGESVITVVPPADEPSEEEVETMEDEPATEEPEVAGEDEEDEENKDEEQFVDGYVFILGENAFN